MAKELSRQVSIQAVQATASGTTIVSGQILDMSNWEGVIGLVFNNTTMNATASGSRIQWRDGTATGSIEDTTATQVMNTNTLYMDVFRPARRFGNFAFRTTTSGDIKTLFQIQYGPKNLPATQPASTTGSRHYSPASATGT